MKKLISLFLCVLLLAGCAPVVYEGPTESAWVRTETCFTGYDPDNGESWTRQHTHAYDTFGNRVHTCYYENGELTEEYRYTYDNRGNCIRDVTWKQFWFFSYPYSRVDYTYDDQNRPLTITYRNGLGFKTGENTYTYDDEANTVTWHGTYDTQTKYLNENGDLIRVVSFSEPAGSESETRYEYDDLGRNTKTTYYQDGALSTIQEYHYDDQDRVLAYTLLDPNGTVLRRDTYHYEENTVTITEMDGYRTVEYLRPDGQIEKRGNYYPSGELSSRTEYTYREIQVPAKEE